MISYFWTTQGVPLVTCEAGLHLLGVGEKEGVVRLVVVDDCC